MMAAPACDHTPGMNTSHISLISSAALFLGALVACSSNSTTTSTQGNTGGGGGTSGSPIVQGGAGGTGGTGEALQTDFAFARVDWLDPVVRTDSDPTFALRAGRDIQLRVFLTSSVEDVEAPPILLQVLDVGDHVLHEATIHPDGLLGNQEPDLSIPTGSFRYKLNGEWIQPGVQIKLTIQADERGKDLNASNNVWMSTPPVDHAQTFYVTVVPFKVGDEDQAYLPSEALGDDATRDAVKSNLMPFYPFTDVKVRVIHTPIQSSVATGTRNWVTFLNELRAFKKADGPYGYYMGFVRLLPGFNSVLGESDTPGPAVTLQAPNKSDGTETNGWRGTMRHELGHNFDLGHITNPSCGSIEAYDTLNGAVPGWGYDVSTDQMIPPTTRAMMTTGCTSSLSWWSHITYNKIENYIRSFKNGLSQPPANLPTFSEWK
jgi:hypothetical protein